MKNTMVNTLPNDGFTSAGKIDKIVFRRALTKRGMPLITSVILFDIGVGPLKEHLVFVQFVFQ